MEQSVRPVARVEAANVTATGPFVVNLCASTAPIDIKSGSLPGLERHRLYQIRRVEDERPRYRLRLGFFADEAAAETALAAVREFYPAAFSVPAAGDDLKHAPGFDASVLGGRQPVADTRNAAVTGTYQRMPLPSAAPTLPANIRPVSTVTTSMAEAPARTQAPAKKPDLPPPVPTQASKVTNSGSVPVPHRLKAEPTVPARPKVTLVLEDNAPFIASNIPGLDPPAIPGGPILIDSTQTLRMLTEAELADTDAPLWFAVQLAVSEQPINLDTMPKLDIFSAFRLYSIAMNKQGKILHSLRLGFFRESVSAEAVSGYLKTFFANPDVLRVSAAEHTRFADPPAPPVLLEPAGKSARVVPLHPNPGQGKAPRRPPQDNTKVMPPGNGQPRQVPVAKGAPTKPAFKAAAQSASPRAAPSATVARKSGPPVGKKPANRKPSLNELLHEEARQVELSESGIRSIESKGSLLSRLVGKLTR